MARIKVVGEGGKTVVVKVSEKTAKALARQQAEHNENAQSNGTKR